VSPNQAGEGRRIVRARIHHILRDFGGADRSKRRRLFRQLARYPEGEVEAVSRQRAARQRFSASREKRPETVVEPSRRREAAVRILQETGYSLPKNLSLCPLAAANGVGYRYLKEVRRRLARAPNQKRRRKLRLSGKRRAANRVPRTSKAGVAELKSAQDEAASQEVAAVAHRSGRLGRFGLDHTAMPKKVRGGRLRNASEKKVFLANLFLEVEAHVANPHTRLSKDMSRRWLADWDWPNLYLWREAELDSAVLIGRESAPVLTGRVDGRAGPATRRARA